jgi:hypothetical protein
MTTPPTASGLSTTSTAWFGRSRSKLRGGRCRVWLSFDVGTLPASLQADGMPDRVGVPSADVGAAVLRLLTQIRSPVGVLDPQVPAGHRPTAQVELETVASLAAAVHGEWIRIHP